MIDTNSDLVSEDFRNCPSIALVDDIAANDDPLFVFENIGAKARYFRMDELGFCKEIAPPLDDGTTTETQMLARAVSLFDSGAGKACNAWE